ncbi:MAG TPA: four helix bundle protein [Polyangiales bacterium]|nr:four helix bundle protein [Polyangiales bacterium]
MYFDHEKLDVYQRALEALDLCDAIIEQIPTGRAHLEDQLDRAATSVVLNVAEGAGEFSPGEKRRFYRIARRSATEAGAILHIVQRRRHADEQRTCEARELLARVVAMLVRMTKTSQAERARARARAR